MQADGHPMLRPASATGLAAISAGHCQMIDGLGVGGGVIGDTEAHVNVNFQK